MDVEDCIAAALHLAREGEADGERLAIHGGSAGGYTTLCALAFHDDFAAGASYYGVADAETLAADTHKFESRYLDSLIGPYPETAERYRERSPIHFADRISAPVILFQGLEDEVVPPSQAETMVAALRRTACRTRTWRSRASSTAFARRDHRALPGGRAVLLRSGLRLRARRRRGAGGDRQVGRGPSTGTLCLPPRPRMGIGIGAEGPSRP